MKFTVLLIFISLSVVHSQNPIADVVSGIGNLLGLNRRSGEVDNYQNAPYTVVAKYQGYEERQYPSQYWVCRRGSNNDGGMFQSLFGYISGNNNRKAKIDMTVPVMTSHSLVGNGKDMCFYLTREFQSNPPVPTSNNVRLVRMPTINGYAKTIKTGFPNWQDEGKKFMNELSGKVRVDTSMFYSMGYDSPFKLFNRRNEVLLRKI